MADGDLGLANLALRPLLDVLTRLQAIDRRLPEVGLGCVARYCGRIIRAAGSLGRDDPTIAYMGVLDQAAANAELLASQDLKDLAHAELAAVLDVLLDQGVDVVPRRPRCGLTLLQRRSALDPAFIEGLEAGLTARFDDAIASCGFIIEPGSVQPGFRRAAAIHHLEARGAGHRRHLGVAGYGCRHHR